MLYVWNFFSPLLKQTAFTFKRFAKNVHRKRGTFCDNFSKRHNNVGNSCLAAAFENRFKPGTNIFPISPSVLANEVYRHKVKVEKNMKFSPSWFSTLRVAEGFLCLIHRESEKCRECSSTLWHQDVRKIKLFSHFHPPGVVLPVPGVFLQTTFNHINNSTKIVWLQVWIVRSVNFEPFTDASSLPEESRYVNLLCFDDPLSFHA